MWAVFPPTLEDVRAFYLNPVIYNTILMYLKESICSMTMLADWWIFLFRSMPSVLRNFLLLPLPPRPSLSASSPSNLLLFLLLLLLLLLLSLILPSPSLVYHFLYNLDVKTSQLFLSFPYLFFYIFHLFAFWFYFLWDIFTLFSKVLTDF